MSNKHELHHKWLMYSLLFMSVVVGAGWFATSYLGDMARQEIVQKNETAATLLSTHLTDEFRSKRRWDIEVFFKMVKSFLNLATECQGRFHDALVAHATVVCCRYMMLAHRHFVFSNAFQTDVDW